MNSLGVVVPAYRPDIDRLRSYVTALRERLAPATIRIELDAPGPGVEAALADLPASVSVSPRRRGKGAAIAAGFDRLASEGAGERASSDTEVSGEPVGTLAFFDADASTPPPSANAVVSPVLAGDCDLAVGSRRHPAAELTSSPPFTARIPSLGTGPSDPSESLLLVRANHVGNKAW